MEVRSNIMILALAMMIFSGLSFSATNLTGCANISIQDTYYLNQSISGAANISSGPNVPGYQACIRISVDNVILDCQNFQIGGSGGMGILVESPSAGGSISNFTIQNCPETSHTYGIYIARGANGLVSNNTLSSNTYAVYAASSSQTNFTSNKIPSQQYGFYATNTSASMFSFNNVTATNTAFYVYNSNNNSFTDNNASGSSAYTFYFEQSSDNNLSRNIIRYGSSAAVYFYGGSDGAVLANNSVTYGYHGIEFYGSGGAVMSGNTVLNATRVGIYLYQSRYNTIVNNTAQGNKFYDLYIEPGYGASYCANNITDLTGSGNFPILYANASQVVTDKNLSEVVLCNADNSAFTNIIINSTGNNGFYLLYTNGTNMSFIKSSQHTQGISLYASNGNNISNVVANQNSLYDGFNFQPGYGLVLDGSSSNNYFFNYTAILEHTCFAFLSGTNNTCVQCHAGNISSTLGMGYNIQDSGNTFADSDVSYTFGYDGFRIASNDNVFINITTFFTGKGMDFLSGQNNTIRQSLFQNSTYGVYVAAGQTLNLTNSTAFGNIYGFYISNMLSGYFKDLVGNKNSYGFQLSLSSLNIVHDIIMQNSTTDDFRFSTAADSHCNNNIDNILISGGLLNYTNNSITVSGVSFLQYLLCNADYSNITNVSALGLNGFGIKTYRTDFTNISNSTIKGLYMETGHDNYVLGNDCFNASYCYYTNQMTNVRFINNSAHNFTGLSFYITSTSDSLFQGNQVYNTSGQGFYFTSSLRNNVTNNSALITTSGTGFHFYNADDDSRVYYNVVYGTSRSQGTGFWIESCNNCQIFGNRAAGIGTGFDGYTFRANITNLTAYNDTTGVGWDGFANNISRIVSYDNLGVGIAVSDYSSSVGTATRLFDSITWNNSYAGITLSTYDSYASNSLVVNNVTSLNNTLYGIAIDHRRPNGVNITNSTSQENGRYDLYLDPQGLCGTFIANLTGSGNRPILFSNSSVTWQNQVVSEIILCNSENSVLDNITVIGSDTLNNNALIVTCSRNITVSNSNSSNNYQGFWLDCNALSAQCANYRVFNNFAQNNTVEGFKVSGGTNAQAFNFTLLQNNTALGNAFGIAQFYSVQYANYTLNHLFNNSYGILVVDNPFNHLASIPRNTTFRGNEISNSSQYGAYLNNSENNTFIGDHFANNAQDIRLRLVSYPTTNNLTNVILDSPSAGLTNFTNLTLRSVAGIDITINWSAQPASPPSPSFAGKFFSITTNSGSPTVNSLLMSWLASEVTAEYDENSFDIFKYSASAWTDMNATLNTSIHTLNLTNVGSFSVFGILNVTAPPPPSNNLLIALNLPGDNAVFNASTVNFNFTATSTNTTILNCSLFTDGILRQTNSSTRNDTLTNFRLASIADGRHNWSISCNDNATWNSSISRNFTVDTAPPVVNLNLPPAGALLGSGNVDFNFTATDNVATSFACSILLNGVFQTTNSSVQNNTPTIFSFGSLADGRYNWTINCTDAAGNRGFGPTRNFTIDTTPPAVNLNLPGNNAIINTSSVSLNFTATDNRASTMDCSLYLDGVFNQNNPSVLNNTLTNFNVPAIADGLHNWSVACNDSINAASSPIRNFTAQNTAPVITLNSPADLAVIGSGNVDFNFTATDNVAASFACSILLNGVFQTTNSSVQNNTPTIFSFTGLPDGRYNWSINCTNSAGNRGDSATRRFIIDTTPPAVNLNLPGNNAIINTSSVNLNFTATDNRASTMNCSLYLDGALDQTNPGVVNNTLTNFNVPAVPQGRHNWSVRCNDTLNSATSATRNFTVDTAPPLVALNLPSDGAVINTTSVNFNFTATDERATVMSCGLYVDSTLRSTDSSVANDTLTNFVLSGLANGNHSWSVTCSDGINSGSSSSRNFSLNVTYPPSTPSSGGGEESRPLSVSFASSCDGNVVGVTSSGKPKSEIRVLVDDGQTQDVYFTDEAGQVSFAGCDGTVTISASASGYKPKTVYSQALIACSSCGETVIHCQTDQVPTNGVCVPRCQAGQVFLDGKCQPKCEEGQELQGGICVPLCKAPSCCKDDSACADDYYCSNRDTGAATGSCIPVTGCGVVSGHTISQSYQCGDEPYCVKCPQGSACVDHVCLNRDINGTGGFIGQIANIVVVEQGRRCALCKVIVTDPNGGSLNMTSDANGVVAFPLSFKGEYRITLLGRDGNPVKAISVVSLPKPTVPPETAPTLLDSLLPCWPWLLLLLLIIAGLIIYWRTRGEKGAMPKAGLPKSGTK